MRANPRSVPSPRTLNVHNTTRHGMTSSAGPRYLFMALEEWCELEQNRGLRACAFGSCSFSRIVGSARVALFLCLFPRSGDFVFLPCFCRVLSPPKGSKRFASLSRSLARWVS